MSFRNPSPIRFLMYPRATSVASPQPASQPHSGERFSDQCVRRLKTSGAPDQESVSTQPPPSHPRGPQGLSTQTRKASWAPTVTSILFPPGSWSPAGRRGAMESPHHPSALPQHGNPEETAARSSEHLQYVLFPLHG